MSELSCSLLEEACSRAQAVSVHQVHPNPRVGCALQTLAGDVFFGVHAKCGEAHAEVNALNAAKLAGANIEGATAYVTLEPCSHTGKTGPCVEALIKAKVRKVVVGGLDPFQQRLGLGVRALQEAGVEVHVVNDENCRALNREWLFAQQHQRPYVVLKIATTLDGFFALPDGKSQFITGEPARNSVHLTRARVQGILTSRSTVENDNPQFTVRIAGYLGPQPNVFVLSSQNADSLDWNALKIDKKRVHFVTSKDGLKAALQKVFKDHSVHALMVECGPRMAHAFLAEGLVEELHHYVAPKYFGAGLGFQKAFLFSGLDGLKGCQTEMNSFANGDFLVKSYFTS